MTPEDKVRRSVILAKGGIEWAGIDERVLIPNLVADLTQARSEGFAKAREMAARIADEICLGWTESQHTGTAIRAMQDEGEQ